MIVPDGRLSSLIVSDLALIWVFIHAGGFSNMRVEVIIATLKEARGKGIGMDFKETMVGLEQLFDRNPAYVRTYADVILFCERELLERDAAEFASKCAGSVFQTQSGESIIATLIKRGALERRIAVDGFTYEGTLNDLQSDDSIEADSSIEYFVQSTDAGMEFAGSFGESTSVSALFSEFPQHVDGFTEVIRACDVPEGKTTKDIQEALIAAGLVGPGSGSPSDLHASYFTSKLERFGALVWRQKRWHATQEGIAALGTSK